MRRVRLWGSSDSLLGQSSVKRARIDGSAQETVEVLDDSLEELAGFLEEWDDSLEGLAEACVESVEYRSSSCINIAVSGFPACVSGEGFQGAFRDYLGSSGRGPVVSDQSILSEVLEEGGGSAIEVRMEASNEQVGSSSLGGSEIGVSGVDETGVKEVGGEGVTVQGKNQGAKKVRVSLVTRPITDVLHYMPREIEGGFLNLASVEVPQAVAVLLSFGPRFCPPGRFTLREGVETGIFLFDKAVMNKFNPRDYFRDRVNYLGDVLVAELKKGDRLTHQDRVLQQMFCEARMFFQKHEELVLVASDKGSSLVLMTSEMYEEKMNAWIGNCVERGVYSMLVGSFRDVRLSLRENFSRLRGRLLSGRYVVATASGGQKETQPPYMDLDTWYALRGYRESKVMLSYLYGVVKTHKEGLPCRPICSTQHWYTYYIQKIVCRVLTRLFSKRLNQGNVGNVEDALKGLRTVPLCEGYVFLKLDIVDMYTSMSKEDIVRCLKYLLDEDKYRTVLDLDRELLFECIDFCFNSANFFMYRSRIYRQERGLPQGGCDSGILATLLLDYYLDLYREELFEQFGIVFYWKYVDDFLLYVREDVIGDFKKKFEDLTGLKVTLEEEQAGVGWGYEGVLSSEMTISFLDILLVRSKRRLNFATYRKPMKSKRTLNYLSRDKFAWKVSTVTQYISKVLRRTSNRFLMQDLAFREEQFYANMYPQVMIASLFRKTVTAHIVDLKGSGSEWVTNTGEIKEREEILNVFMRRFRDFFSVEEVVSECETEVPVSTGGASARIIYGKRTIKYTSTGVSGLIGLMCREYGLGWPSISKAPTLFQRLGMSLRDKAMSEVAGAGGNHEYVVYLLCCLGCDRCFFLCGVGLASSILADVKERRDSVVSQHVRAYGHKVGDQMVPLRGIKGLRPGLQLRLFRDLYTAYGMQCSFERIPDSFPSFVSDITRRCVEGLEEKGRPGCAVLGVPRPSRK